jgi:biotin operon repressor
VAAGEPADRLAAAAQAVDELATRIGRGEAVSRNDLNALIAEIQAARREIFGPRPRAAKGKGGRKKILDYLKARAGTPVAGEELATISDIGEWARRVRELRVQEGWDITELGGSLYRLESPQRDEERARKWQLLNGLRRRKGSVESRVRAVLEAFVGEVLTRDEIDYVGRRKEATRRLRELRDEEGWPIETHVDDPSLKPGEYRLASSDPNDFRDPLQRLYDDDVRERVFERDNYTCQVCGRDRDSALRAGATRFWLELHHKVAVADELAELPKSERNKIENLVTLCHDDHVKETGKLQRRKREERRAGRGPA